MRYIILLIALVAFSANAQEKYKAPKQDKECPKVWNVTKNSTFDFYGSVYKTLITFKTKEDYIEELKRDKELQMWSEEDYQKKVNAFSTLKGGIIYINITRTTIGAANTKYFTVIVKDLEGNELFRQKLKDKIADYSMRGSQTDWNNSDFVIISNELPKEFNVYVVDDIKSERYEYIIKQ